MRLPTSGSLTAIAGLVGLGLMATTTPASAHTYVRCDPDGDRCVRIHCDCDGDDCWRESVYYNRPYYYGRGRWECDDDGDDCRRIYYHRPYYRRYYQPVPRFSFGFRF